MKKKTLIVLLVIPFIISLLTFTSIVLADIIVASDILDIAWDYRETEGYKIDEEHTYPLKATAVTSENQILAQGNELVWYLTDNEEEAAEIIEDGEGNYSLSAKQEGEVRVVCSNAKGNVSKSFQAVIYHDGAVIINPTLKGTGQQVENLRNFGEFDLKYDSVSLDAYTKEQPAISFDIRVMSDDPISNNVRMKAKSRNIEYDASANTAKILDDGEAYFTLYSVDSPYIEGTYRFNVVQDAVNVYDYNDLLMATNFSTMGEVAVMQVNLGSLRDTYEGKEEVISEASSLYRYVPDFNKPKSENTKLFGNVVDQKKLKFNFAKEFYTFDTTYNHKFLEDNDCPSKVIAGIHVKKDFFGNGFKINMHELAYPTHGQIDTNVKKFLPTPGEDYFFGPLAYVTIGNPAEILSIVKAYGQDNCGFYIDNDGITLNDLRLQNMDPNNNRKNYNFVGTVLDICAKDVTVKNCVLSNGKNIVRAFSSDNLLIDNSILSTSGEFNLLIGNNEHSKADQSKDVSFSYQGETYKKSFANFYNEGTPAPSQDTLLQELFLPTLSGQEAKDEAYAIFQALQGGLDNASPFFGSNGETIYGSKIQINDTYFYDSGIFSIALESLFNGPFLYNGAPDMVRQMLSILSSPAPDNIGGTSSPSLVTLTGDTAFYDWKNIDNIDITGLVEENISAMLGDMIDGANITIDDFFPIKELLRDYAREKGYLYVYEGHDHVNSEIAYYGGGLNLSKVVWDLDETNDKNTFSEEILTDLLSASIYSDYTSNAGQMIGLLRKAVLLAAGFNAFRFVTNSSYDGGVPPLFFDSPKVENLRDNLRK